MYFQKIKYIFYYCLPGFPIKRVWTFVEPIYLRCKKPSSTMIYIRCSGSINNTYYSRHYSTSSMNVIVLYQIVLGQQSQPRISSIRSNSTAFSKDRLLYYTYYHTIARMHSITTSFPLWTIPFLICLPIVQLQRNGVNNNSTLHQNEIPSRLLLRQHSHYRYQHNIVHSAAEKINLGMLFL